MIASLFSGIAINLERSYQIGDWIEIEAGAVGKVLEVSWLTTRIVTRDGIAMVSPTRASRPRRSATTASPSRPGATASRSPSTTRCRPSASSASCSRP